MSDYDPQVGVTVIAKNIKHNMRRQFYRCFGSWFYQDYQLKSKVFYRCKINKTLNEQDINYFLSFLVGILGEHFKYKKFKEYIIFYVNCKKLEFISAKTILTLCRYLQEFPEIVNEFYEQKAENFEDQFKVFAQININPPKLSFYDNLWGHGFSYYGEKKIRTLKDFKNQIKKPKIANVRNFIFFS